MLFSKGGYVSVPPVIAAYILGIPIFTHESDIDPGLATRINSIFAKKVFVSFEKTLDYFPPKVRARVLVTGNPVRREVLAGDADRGRRKLGCKRGERVVLFLGGSQGARAINDLVFSMGKKLLASGCCIIHQTGSKDEIEKHSSFDESLLRHPKYFGIDFIREDFPDFLAAADLVVSRAGAGAIWEFAAVGKPAILIPLPTSGSRGDQIRNAQLLEEIGGAILFREEGISPVILLETILELLNNREKLRRLSSNIKLIYRGDASRIISEEIVKYLEGDNA